MYINTSKPEFNYNIGFLHGVGGVLVSPFSYATRQLIRATDPIMPERAEAMDQYNTRGKEVAKRVAVFATMPFLVLISLPFCAGGELLKVGASALAKKKLVIASDPHRVAEVLVGNQIRSLTFNVAAMHEPLRKFNQTRPVEVRMKEIVQYIKDNHSDADTISFQECFTEEATKILVEGLMHIFPHAVHNVGENTIGVNSGLIVLSKYPIRKAEFRVFPERKGENAWSQKGALGVVMDLGQGRSGVLINTHMEAGGGRPAAEVDKARKSQVAIIKALTEKLEGEVKEEGRDLIFSAFTGDTNITYRSGRVYREIFQPFLEDYYEVDVEAKVGSVLETRILQKEDFISAESNFQRKNRLDYAEFKKLDAHQASVTTTIHRDTKDMSDHFPVESIYTFLLNQMPRSLL